LKPLDCRRCFRLPHEFTFSAAEKPTTGDI
jgi:hypothetical protein